MATKNILGRQGAVKCSCLSLCPGPSAETEIRLTWKTAHADPRLTPRAGLGGAHAPVLTTGPLRALSCRRWQALLPLVVRAVADAEVKEADRFLPHSHDSASPAAPSPHTPGLWRALSLSECLCFRWQALRLLCVQAHTCTHACTRMNVAKRLM